MILTTSVIAGLFALGLPLLLYILRPLFQRSSLRVEDDTTTKEIVELGIERERSFRPRFRLRVRQDIERGLRSAPGVAPRRDRGSARPD